VGQFGLHESPERAKRDSMVVRSSWILGTSSSP
jgi:hypothetical protein